MPVISSRRYSTTTGSALPPTGSYRTSLDRPYYSSTTGTYITPRVSSYSRSSTLDAYRTETITRNTTTQSPVTSTYRKYSRDVTDSGSRFIRSDSRTREISLDSGITSKSDPLPRSEAALNRALATSAADIINKYSPANYIPKCELVRSRSLSESRQIKEKSQVKSSPCNHSKTFGVNSLYCNNTECTGNIINTNVSLGVQGVPLSVVNSTNSNLYGPSCSTSNTPGKVKPIFRTHPETGRTTSNLISSVNRKGSNLLEKSKVMKTTVPVGKASVSSFRSKTKPEPISKVKEPTRDRVVAIRNTLPSNISTRAGSLDDDDSAAGLNGLRNIGNTCFMNSVLQCLSNTRLLVEFLRRDGYIGEISANGGALIRAFSAVIGELWGPGNSRVVNTSQLKSQVQRFAPRFMGYAQQDAQEFLRYLLEGLHEDVNKVKTKPPPIHTEIDDKLSDAQKAAESWSRYVRCEDSRIVELFVGQLKSTLRCTVCGHSSVTFDPFWDLSLPIPSRVGQLRLSQCLELFTKEEVLDGDEKPTCSKCQVRRKCTKGFSIQKFPKILVIHLKRFSPTERFRGKLNIHVDCPLKGLDMSPYAANSGTPCTYNLYAISNHSGTTYSGHYTAYCKHPYTNEWHEYNDSRVSSISERNVMSSEAYVLFYELSNQSSHL